MSKRLVAAASVAGLMLGAIGLTPGASARLTAGCKEAAVGGHGAGMYIAADDAKGASACVYTPASLDQTYVAATPNAWRILGLRVENGAQVERPILAGGEVSDPNRISAGGFRLAPGERVILEVTSTCKRTGLTTVTIPGTGLGVNPDEECASAGSLSAGS